jgi:lysophospholipase
VAVCAAAVAFGLSACGQKPPEPVESHIPAGLQSRFYPPVSWAWGRLDIEGAPPLRYGVANPAKAVRGQVVILPDAGEPAEAWFETAQDLVDRNYVVWVLDLAGQGGSARWRMTSGRAFTPSMDLDLTALRVLTARIVRPGGAPVVLMGDGLGAQLALRGLAERLPGVDGAVLGDPTLKPRGVDLPGPVDGITATEWISKVGLGRIPAPGGEAWSETDARGRGRWAVGQQWMRGNPELRLGGPSLGWVAAYNRSAAMARDPAVLGRIAVPVLMVARPGVKREAETACAAIKACEFKVLAVEGPAPHLAADPVRAPWLEQTAAFIEARGEGYSVAAAPVRQ